MAMHNELSLSDAFTDLRPHLRDRTAVVDATRAWTYRELCDDAGGLAAALTALGVAPGDRVALLADNCGRWLVAAGAVARAGAVLVPVGTRLQAGEIDHILADSGATAAIVDAAFVPRVAPSVGADHVVVLNGEAEGTTSYGAALRTTAAAAGPPGRPREEDLAALIYTAAVDGRPRGAMMAHKAFAYHDLNVMLLMRISERDTYLNMLPFSHTGGLGMALALLRAGGTVIVAPGFDPAAAARLIDEHGVTMFLTFAPMGGRILEASGGSGPSLASLRLVTGLEAPDTIESWLNAVPGLSWGGGYGQTETHGTVTFGVTTSADELAQRPATAGFPAPGCVLRVVDPDGRDVPANAVGEIVVRGPNVALGYWQDDVATRHALRGGWWHTGDLGRIDAAGRLVYVDRMDEKQLIKTGGENVYPHEVEHVLQGHPAVEGACVFGVADREWGEAVHAVVVKRSDAEVDSGDLVAYVAARIASYKKPRSVRFVDELPRTDGGAPDRAAAREAFAAEAVP